MISAINFNGKTLNGVISDKTNAKGEKVVIMEKPKDGFVRTTVKSVAHVKKAYVGVKEGITGVLSSVFTGLTAGAAVLGLDWFLQKAAGNGVAEQSLLKTPIKTAVGIVGGVCKKVAKVFDKNTNFRQIVTYPFVGFPKDIYNYVKNVKGCSKFGKHTAVAIGIIAAGVAAFKAMININIALAEVDHGFKVGHNR